MLSTRPVASFDVVHTSTNPDAVLIQSAPWRYKAETMRYACRSVRHVYQIRLDDQLFRALFCSPPVDCCTLSSRSIIQPGISLSRFLLFQDKTEPTMFFSFPIYAQEALRHLQVPA